MSVSELRSDFYLKIFDQYSKVKDEVSKEIFVRKAIIEILEMHLEDNIGKESIEFKQNAVLMISSLYFSKELDLYDSESKSLDDLDGDEKNMIASILSEELE